VDSVLKDQPRNLKAKDAVVVVVVAVFREESRSGNKVHLCGRAEIRYTFVTATVLRVESRSVRDLRGHRPTTFQKQGTPLWACRDKVHLGGRAEIRYTLVGVPK